MNPVFTPSAAELWWLLDLLTVENFSPGKQFKYFMKNVLQIMLGYNDGYLIKLLCQILIQNRIISRIKSRIRLNSCVHYLGLQQALHRYKCLIQQQQYVIGYSLKIMKMR